MLAAVAAKCFSEAAVWGLVENQKNSKGIQ